MIRKEILKSGNSLCIYIPKALAELMEIKKGSEVNMDYDGHKLTIEKAHI